MRSRPDTITCHVKRYRQTKGWSQNDLAERIGVRRQAIYDIESGRYLPNTAVALQLAREFGCKVEDLFAEEDFQEPQPVQLIDDQKAESSRLALGRVRGRLVGFPLGGRDSISSGFRPADGLLIGQGKSAQLLCSPKSLDDSVLLLGCDPAFEILDFHVARRAPGARVRCRFASSHKALDGLAAGFAHCAGTHLHNTSDVESNVVLAGHKLTDVRGNVLGFSLLEEGLMVARGNPLGIRAIADLEKSVVRFVNRESGAALRVLLDDRLVRAGIPASAVNGYQDEVSSHSEGATRVACNAADAALGFRAVADAFGLDFVRVAVVRCDLVIPGDLMDHPTIRILTDVLQSSALGRELRSIPGYDDSVTGRVIAEL
jgi:putative molybdopterin biosynthesis protein